MSGASLISVIVTTYNREDALDAVIRALGAQSDQNFEIIIADDGSGPDTTSLIESWKPRLAMPLKLDDRPQQPGHFSAWRPAW